jgi:hypothetical protein
VCESTTWRAIYETSRPASRASHLSHEHCEARKDWTDHTLRTTRGLLRVTGLSVESARRLVPWEEG